MKKSRDDVKTKTMTAMIYLTFLLCQLKSINLKFYQYFAYSSTLSV